MKLVVESWHGSEPGSLLMDYGGPGHGLMGLESGTKSGTWTWCFVQSGGGQLGPQLGGAWSAESLERDGGPGWWGVEGGVVSHNTRQLWVHDMGLP